MTPLGVVSHRFIFLISIILIIIYTIREKYVDLHTYNGKRPLGRPRRRWEYNIRMDLKDIGINTRNWVDSAQDMDYWRVLVNAALKLRVP